jgi:hypothetical protein
VSAPAPFLALLCGLCLSAAPRLQAAVDPTGPPGARWWKGNLHTHSLWSDGDDYPEMIVDWYKQHGYEFLALSDHNILLQGDKWIDRTNNKGGGIALEKYLERFGANWVQQRAARGKQQVRLRTLKEFRPLFEEPGRFLLIQSEEITDKYKLKPVHLNATNLRDFIKPRGGSSVLEVMQNNVDAVFAQHRRTGQPMFPHLNHPNFGWAVTAEDLMRVKGERFFEVYNGHPLVHNEGDTNHADTDRVWDIILAMRLSEPGLGPLYGLANDDAHDYHKIAPTKSNAGRGWVMVRAPLLAVDDLVAAMEAGDFYASSGVRLKDVRRGPGRYEVQIDPEEGVTYTTRFIGTRSGFDRTSEPVRNKKGEPLAVTRRYSPEIGAVFAEVTGTNPTYTLTGEELYVRARIESSRLKENAPLKGEVERAWTQPFIPAGH